MSRRLVWFLFAAVTAASVPAQASTVGVGGCKPQLKNYPTISAAVGDPTLPAGSTIQICPGTYPEQVTIAKPLNLLGVISGNSGRAVVTINNPTGGQLTPNVTNIFGTPYYAQVLVQQGTGGPVNITDITVDGAGGNVNCPSVGQAGVYYAPGTSGTINGVTVRNQRTFSGCGNGIWVENGANGNQTITIENSSVHNIAADSIFAASD